MHRQYFRIPPLYSQQASSPARSLRLPGVQPCDRIWRQAWAGTKILPGLRPLAVFHMPAPSGGTANRVYRRRPWLTTPPNIAPLPFRPLDLPHGRPMTFSIVSARDVFSLSPRLCVRCILRLPYPASDDQEPASCDSRFRIQQAFRPRDSQIGLEAEKYVPLPAFGNGYELRDRKRSWFRVFLPPGSSCLPRCAYRHIKRATGNNDCLSPMHAVYFRIG